MNARRDRAPAVAPAATGESINAPGFIASEREAMRSRNVI